MNKKGQVGAWAYSFMIGLTIIILALALAPSGKAFVDDTMGNSSIIYTYYTNLRDWSSYNTNFTNGEYIMNDTSKVIYQTFSFNKSTLKGEFFVIENITLKLKRVGNPTGDIKISITEGDYPITSNTVNFTNSSLDLSSISTSFEDVTFDLPYPQVYMTLHPYYDLSLNVTGVDSSNYLVVGLTNMTDLYRTERLYEYYYFNESINYDIQLDDEKDVLFKYSLRDGGIEKVGLDCDNPTISNFIKGTCIITDFSLFYFIGGLLLIGGAIITARLIL